MRLATFNILHGRSLADGRVDLARFADAVRRLDADVLALQEVDRAQERSHGADLTAVAADAMGAEHHRFVATLHGEPGLWVAGTGEEQPDAAAYGIALLSRRPVQAWHVLTLPTLRRRAPVRFPGARWPALVRDEPRTALAAVVDDGRGPLTVVGTHLTFIPGWNVRQLRHLVRVTRTMPGPKVVMGDLNLAGEQPSRLSGLRSLVQAPTFPVAEPVRQLDHVLAGPGLHATGAGESLDLGLSDHRALVVDVARAHVGARG
ncbi:endonuclease/exonuclease/phosphatase family protein [Cellulomonas wangsupingiae]|uniref:Endonuclease/exonuclease/phosphatase family protein n=1 Tax=Cellulomonas wangsupingiae TaxID=2968085 RepID=A0ABY5K3M1_9CELL|nr:endonuclease/exonuclease/phosphatase family protein [Cellulomonas wangsupingiae]MCC2335467.1 endonuclease/exonuclease/phosphatase family protein [Cellulomonas wangsupingiae]MCM0640003.1 endonuclease/exonuclease/phosphatase family protein [Cellulomonas wangsupingiae]UUI64359.1 endonuclease/exonuclease/phosphatase family protein [Cellulomonas wangsupingiae]